MVETEMSSDSPVNLRMSATRVARKVGRAILEFARDYSRAQQAAALAEADCKNPERPRALYLNDPAEPSKRPPE